MDPRTEYRYSVEVSAEELGLIQAGLKLLIKEYTPYHTSSIAIIRELSEGLDIQFDEEQSK